MRQSAKFRLQTSQKAWRKLLSKYLTGEMLRFFAEFDYLMQWLHLGCCVNFLLLKKLHLIPKSISTHKNKFVLGYKKWMMRGGVVGLFLTYLSNIPIA